MTHLSLWSGRVILACTLLLIPVTLFAKAAPNLLIGLITLASFVLLWDQQKLRDLKSIPQPIMYFVFLAVWALASCFWSPDFKLSLTDGLKLASVIVVGMILYTTMRYSFVDRLMNSLTYGYLIGLALLLIDINTNHAIFYRLKSDVINPAIYSHAITLMLLLVWPILSYYTKPQKAIVYLLIPILAIIVYLSSFHASKLALSIGFTSWILALLMPKLFLRATAIVSAIVILSFPWLVNKYSYEKIVNSAQSFLIKSSYQHRIVILKRASMMIAEKPFIGHGINTYQTTLQPEIINKLDYGRLTKTETPLTKDEIMLYGQENHPHNLSMQIWYELGAVGALLLAFFILKSLWYISSVGFTRTHMATFAGFYTTAAVISHVSFGAWQTWWLLGLTFTLCFQLSRMNIDKKERDT